MKKYIIAIAIILPIAIMFVIAETNTSTQSFYAGVKAHNLGDYESALENWKPLAEQGHARTQYNLGLMYSNGEGVLQDYKQAEKYYRLAAEQGDAHAQYNLGGMYYNGEGVPKDIVLAYVWANLAAAQGNNNGSKVRDLAVSEMTATQIEKAQELSRLCFSSNFSNCP